MKEHQRAILDLFKDLAPGRVLDAGSGGDAIGEGLVEMGFDVVSLDLYTASGVEGSSVRADLNKALPFGDQTFEYVLLSETLQYLENHAALTREFTRLLSPAGSVVLSMPNILNASSRFSFFLRGWFPNFKPVRDVDPGKGWDSVAYNVVSLVDVVELAAKFGLELAELRASGFKSSASPLYLILKALYALGRPFERNARKAGLLALLSSREALLGDHLILRFCPGGAGSAGAAGR